MTDYVPSISIQSDFLDFLMTAPSPQEMIDFHASESAQERLRYLLEENRQGVLTPYERADLDEASQMYNLVTLLKARAHKTLPAR